MLLYPDSVFIHPRAGHVAPIAVGQGAALPRATILQVFPGRIAEGP